MSIESCGSRPGMPAASPEPGETVPRGVAGRNGTNDDQRKARRRGEDQAAYRTEDSRPVPSSRAPGLGPSQAMKRRTTQPASRAVILPRTSHVAQLGEQHRGNQHGQGNGRQLRPPQRDRQPTARAQPQTERRCQYQAQDREARQQPSPGGTASPAGGGYGKDRGKSRRHRNWTSSAAWSKNPKTVAA